MDICVRVYLRVDLGSGGRRHWRGSQRRMRAVHACVLLAVCAAALLALNVAGSGSAVELESEGIQQTVAHEMRKRVRT